LNQSFSSRIAARSSTSVLRIVEMTSKQNTISFSVIFISIIAFFLLNLVLGTIAIPIRSIWNILWNIGDESVIWQNIVWKSRFPQTITALFAGAGLAISGLQMQTVFRNPLAGPSESGISSGASLGVATIILLSGSISGRALSRMGLMGEVAITISAIIGAMAVMAIILAISQR